MRTHRLYILPATAVLVLGACTACSVGPTDRGPETSPQASVGPNPVLPAPEKKAIPVVRIAEAKGWPPGTVHRRTARRRLAGDVPQTCCHRGNQAASATAS